MKINLVNMHKEISTVSASFLGQQTLNGIKMVMMMKEEEEKNKQEKKKLFLATPQPPTQWITLSLGQHHPRYRQPTGLSSLLPHHMVSFLRAKTIT